MENSHDVVLKKLDKLLGNRVDHMYNTKPEFDEAIYERMFNFVTSLDPDQLTEEQAATIVEMIEDIEIEFEGEDEDKVDEAVPKKVRRDKQAQRERRKKYRKEKAKLKQKAKRYRKSAKGKQMARKSKRYAKVGKTATGKKKRTYTN